MTEEKGLYDKYEVYENGEPIEECFVLEPESDPAAQEALLAYASATDNKQLENDLREWAYSHILSESDRVVFCADCNGLVGDDHPHAPDCSLRGEFLDGDDR